MTVLLTFWPATADVPASFSSFLPCCQSLETSQAMTQPSTSGSQSEKPSRPSALVSHVDAIAIPTQISSHASAIRGVTTTSIRTSGPRRRPPLLTSLSTTCTSPTSALILFSRYAICSRHASGAVTQRYESFACQSRALIISAE